MLPLLAKLRTFRNDTDTDQPLRIFAVEMGMPTLKALRRYEDAGVTDIVVAFRNLYAVAEDQQTLAQKIDDLNRFADSVLTYL